MEAALQLVEAEGFDALTMRRVAAGATDRPGVALRPRAQQGGARDLLIGELCKGDPAHARGRRIGGSRSSMSSGNCATNTSATRGYRAPRWRPSRPAWTRFGSTKGMLAILLAGGVPPQSAAWAIDAAIALRKRIQLRGLAADGIPRDGTDAQILDRAELIERFRMLPASRFPNTVAYAGELTSGDGHERFDFTLELLLRGLTPATR